MLWLDQHRLAQPVRSSRRAIRLKCYINRYRHTCSSTQFANIGPVGRKNVLNYTSLLQPGTQSYSCVNWGNAGWTKLPWLRTATRGPESRCSPPRSVRVLPGHWRSPTTTCARQALRNVYVICIFFYFFTDNKRRRYVCRNLTSTDI